MSTFLDGAKWVFGGFTSRLSTQNLTANRNIDLPNRSGTLAMIDQIPSDAKLNEIAMIGTPFHNTSASNVAASIVLAAPGVGIAYQLNSLIFSYNQLPTNGLLTVSNGSGTIYAEVAITSAGAGPALAGIKLPLNTPLSIVLSAGGAGVIGRVSASISTV